jgi:hypothetical protein
MVGSVLSVGCPVDFDFEAAVKAACWVALIACFLVPFVRDRETWTK